MKKTKYLEVVDEVNEQDRNVFPVRLMNLPSELVEEAGSLSKDLIEIGENGETNPVSVFFLKQIDEQTYNEKKACSEIYYHSNNHFNYEIIVLKFIKE